MENGAAYGSRTDHDRQTFANGVNGGTFASAADKAAVEDDGMAQKLGSPAGKLLTNGVPERAKDGPSAPLRPSRPSKMEDLPDEIQHITAEMMPLGLLISRLAQVSHNQLQDVVGELAMKQIPAPLVNGSGPDYRNTTVEDTNGTSLEKKRLLLEFIQGLHAKWVKALVITDWSKKAGQVSKLIDLKVHLQQQLGLYDDLTNNLINLREGLAVARLPSPNLKTALQVLRTGEAPWIPELGYIEPPPMTPQEQMRWIEDLNTLLAVRLSVEDYEAIPIHFRDYRICSGRVTFKVEGEFEVDLTIADEDFQQQFWFIDFRFLFRPAPAELSDSLRAFLEVQVNEKLAAEGLSGCYSFLHEFVLTHKITEFMRQALELRRSRWTETLRVERVNRALSIQYWASRYLAPNAPKSWFILGVEGRRKSASDTSDVDRTSRLSLRWFKDNKEVKDAAIPFNTEDISAEDVLKAVIAHHIDAILSAIYNKLAAKPRFFKREGALTLCTDLVEPSNSTLTMQLIGEDMLVSRIDMVTGLWALNPHTRHLSLAEQRLNYGMRDVSEEGSDLLESLRSAHISDGLKRRGKSMGWSVAPTPLKNDELKPIVQTREAFQTIWLKRQGWLPQWMVVLTLSLGGDRWFLLRLSDESGSNARVLLNAPLALNISPKSSFTSRFFKSLTILATGLITFLTDEQKLSVRKIASTTKHVENDGLPPDVKLPGRWTRLSDIVPGGGSKRPVWAEDSVCVFVTGVKAPLEPTGDALLEVVGEARIKVKDKVRFGVLAGDLGDDIAFNNKLGVFALRLRVQLSQSLFEALQVRLRALERLVDFVEAVRREGKVRCDKVTITEVKFTYSSEDIVTADPNKELKGQAWTACLDLASVKLSIHPLNPHNRVLDILNSLIPSPEGLERLPSLLPLTLPMLRGLDSLNETWTSLASEGKGEVVFMHRDLESLAITFSTSTISSNGQISRVRLSCALQPRRGELWWQVTQTKLPGEDDFSNALFHHVWNTTGARWRGLANGAAARPVDGIEDLLQTIDTVLRNVIDGKPQAAAGSSPQMVSEQSNTTATALTAPGTSFSSLGPGGSQGRSTQPTQLSDQGQGQSSRPIGTGKGNAPIILD